ncbi:MAG: class I SAM-dependent methyltransferase [Candidatus Binatia bacterium]
MDQEILSRYNSPEGATDYAHKFERHWTERLNNWHEQRLLRRLLRSADIAKLDGIALDLPCGYGRLYAIVRELGARVVEGDWSFPLLATAKRYHLEHDTGQLPAGYVRATALRLPFHDCAFELVLSVRLSHHIREQPERIQHLCEVMRVSRKWVMFTYFDAASFKNRTHERRRRYNGKRSKWTLSFEQVQELAQAEGFQVAQWAWLSRLFSGHRYTLLQRKATNGIH